MAFPVPESVFPMLLQPFEPVIWTPAFAGMHGGMKQETHHS